MLKEMKQFVKERGTVTLSDIAIHFRMDESAVEGGLRLLQKKNIIIKEDVLCCNCSSGCGCEGSCGKVGQSVIRIHWNGSSLVYE